MSHLLTEAGDALLTETGAAFLIEPVAAPDPSPLFWSADASAWRPWPGALVIGAQHYDLRWSTPGPDEACLLEVATVLDVADVIEFLDDVALPATPTRLPITRLYRRILNVQLTVVQTTGEPVRVADVLDKSTTGPLVRSRFADGTATEAIVDAIVKGY